MAARIRYAIFDLDGTLLDSEPLYTLSAERVCARYGATFTLALKQQIMGGDTLTGATLVTRALGLALTPEQYIAERERELDLLLPTLAPMPHAPTLIAALEQRAIPLALATSGHRAITDKKLAQQPFLQRIPALVTGDDPRLIRGKPAPDIFLLAARELGADPSECLVVEDSVLGTRAALAAGMHTVALVDPRYGFDPALFAGAAQVIASLAELDLERLLEP